MHKEASFLDIYRFITNETFRECASDKHYSHAVFIFQMLLIPLLYETLILIFRMNDVAKCHPLFLYFSFRRSLRLCKLVQNVLPRLRHLVLVPQREGLHPYDSPHQRSTLQAKNRLEKSIIHHVISSVKKQQLTVNFQTLNTLMVVDINQEGGVVEVVVEMVVAVVLDVEVGVGGRNNLLDAHSRIIIFLIN